MTSGLATIQQLHNTPDLPESDRAAAQAVASGIRDAKADNTRRAYACAWQRFQTWADTGGHQPLPATPEAVALYLGHLAAAGLSVASIAQARAAISHFHATAGMQKADNPTRHPLVAEAMKGWRNRAPAPKQADALTVDALTRVREVPARPTAWPRRTDGINGDCPTPGRPGSRHHRSPGRRRSPALRGRRPHLGRRGAVARRHGPDHGPEGQEPGSAGNRGSYNGHRPCLAGY